MTSFRIALVTFCATALAALALAENNTPPQISPNDAKNYIGQTATVCGKVVDTKVPKYGIAGHGKPVSLFLNQPEADAVFYFVAFGSKPDDPQEVVTTYGGKRVCVTGQVNQVSGKTFIMASDRSQIKPDTSAK